MTLPTLPSLSAVLADITQMSDLITIVGFIAGVALIIAYPYAVITIISALIGDKHDGTWKYGLIRGGAIFVAAGVVTIIMVKALGQTVKPIFQ
jgi:hypothetical protein